MKAICKQVLLIFTVLCLVSALGACSSKPAGYGGKSFIGGRRTDAALEVADGVDMEGEYAAKKSSADGSPSEGGETATVRAGQITAGAQNDNLFYSQWLNLFSAGEALTPEEKIAAGYPEDAEIFKERGRFWSFLSDTWGMASGNRLTVTVRCGDSPVAGAKVVATCAGGTTFSAVTDATGVAYLFPDDVSGTVRATSGSHAAEAPFSAETRELTLSLDGAVSKTDVIDLMFVVDVTGSMGDEISYLQAEIDDVIGRVAAANANAKINLAFLFYRDTDDRAPFAYVDFKDVTDPGNLALQRAALAKQRADGGGDYEEAVDEALALAVSKQWTPGATKLIFLVLDAPAHSGQIYQTRFSGAVRSAAEQGIRICPVLASGADTVCEYTTRSAALLTGGTFVFITNDSGIGGDHLDPGLPNVTVEYLNDCLVRLVNGYHTGVFADPVAWNAQN